ncbi:hypothetical protein [Desulfoluna spongiiphila]|uniref:hypothetical protein n=1 Tax=Desulfoluna spongiiphila TaxID=419481 RepID=UPI00125EA36E|nr:hypothetical protein [Desulfoluna spongiiphila]
MAQTVIKVDVCLKGGCDLTRGTRSKAHSQFAFKVAHHAAGGSQVKDASGGPAGGQTFEKFDKQVLLNLTETFAEALTLRNEGGGLSQPGVQGIIAWPPEAGFPCPL